MAVDLRDVRTVVLPGTGSDDDYLYRAFSPALRLAGAIARPHRPQPAGLIAGYLRALEEAAQDGPIAVAGVSLGAAVAVSWAITHPDLAVAVLAALPAWTGSPAHAPAALAALHTATELRRDGLEVTIARMRESSPSWLAAELSRSWTNQWPGLPDAMVEAAHYVAPTTDQLSALSAPMAVVSASDDPVHPLAVGVQWVAAAPRAALRTVTLEQIGTDPSILGSACLAALDDI